MREQIRIENDFVYSMSITYTYVCVCARERVSECVWVLCICARGIVFYALSYYCRSTFVDRKIGCVAVVDVDVFFWFADSK